MDFWGTVLVLFRRWYISLPAFALSVAAAFGVYSTIPVVYVSNAVLVLTTPTTGGTVAADPRIRSTLINPMLNFEHGLSVSASILIAALGTPDVARDLGVSEGGDTEYQVTNGSSNLESLATGPLVFVEANSTSPEKASQMVRRVIQRARLELDIRQKAVNAPKGTYISMSEAVPPTTPRPQQGRRMRATAAALGTGLIASLTATFAVESLLGRRRRSRSLAHGPALPGPRPPAPAQSPVTESPVAQSPVESPVAVASKTGAEA
ncbi:hypothetical protein AB0K60_26410 [Thermopolyspora sp. NPDC052614]|uniref:hypothetical protein n=1 Tax=Thermopolyspora sp. NPDC052614 TaxID=3155682 RepID=UPI00344312C6